MSSRFGFWPCCDEGLTGCANCTTSSPDTWRVVVSGITNAIDSGCNVFNGTHDIPNTFGPGPAPNKACTWTLSLGGGYQIQIQLRDLGGSNRYSVLFTTPSGADIFEELFATTICNTAKDVDFISVVTYCAGWPAEMTITPL